VGTFYRSIQKDFNPIFPKFTTEREIFTYAFPLRKILPVPTPFEPRLGKGLEDLLVKEKTPCPNKIDLDLLPGKIPTNGTRVRHRVMKSDRNEGKRSPEVETRRRQLAMGSKLLESVRGRKDIVIKEEDPVVIDPDHLFDEGVPRVVERKSGKRKDSTLFWKRKSPKTKRPLHGDKASGGDSDKN
jgi:hypothetical protein